MSRCLQTSKKIVDFPVLQERISESNVAEPIVDASVPRIVEVTAKMAQIIHLEVDVFKPQAVEEIVESVPIMCQERISHCIVDLSVPPNLEEYAEVGRLITRKRGQRPPQKKEMGLYACGILRAEYKGREWANQ